MSDWLDAARQALLYDIALTQPHLTAAGFHQYTGSTDAILGTYGQWRNSLDSEVLPQIGVAFGEAFNAARKSSEYSAYRWQQEYMHEVRDRLVIWPEGAFEDIRPEIEEALAEGESFEQIKDRVGRVLNIDAATREIRADINEVDKALADPNTDPDDIPELRQRRRQLWQAHDESLGEWEWLARRIARTEAHGAREGGALAAAQAMELATGDKYYKRWLSTDDDRTRLTHRVADGQMVPLASPFLVGGFPLQHPGDPEGPAHEVIQCRCSLQILDEGEVQEELQGQDGSLGEVRPGGMRLGPDDPDEARAAVEALAEERGVNPGKDYRADSSVLQAMQPAQPPKPPIVVPADQRGAEIPDLTGHSQADLTDMMDRAYDAENWPLFEAIEAELTRRDEDDADPIQQWLDAEQGWLNDPLPGLPLRDIPDGRDLGSAQGRLFDANEVVLGANPDYAQGKEWQVNCQRCVQAEELRHRGYDATAMPVVMPDAAIDPSSWTPVVLESPPFPYPLTDADRRRIARDLYPDSDGFTDAMRDQVQFVSFSDLWRERDGSPRPFTLADTRRLADDLEQLPAWSRGWVRVDWASQDGAHIFSFQVQETLTGQKVVRFTDPQSRLLRAEDHLSDALGKRAYWKQTDDLMPAEAVRDMIDGR